MLLSPGGKQYTPTQLEEEEDVGKYMLQPASTTPAQLKKKKKPVTCCSQPALHLQGCHTGSHKHGILCAQPMHDHDDALTVCTDMCCQLQQAEPSWHQSQS